MPFSPEERKLLLTVKGVGPTVVSRLEQQGFSSLAGLAEADAEEILQWAAAETGSTCWKNSPLARQAIHGAVALARRKFSLT